MVCIVGVEHVDAVSVVLWGRIILGGSVVVGMVVVGCGGSGLIWGLVVGIVGGGVVSLCTTWIS